MREHFDTLIQTVTRQIAGRPLDHTLQAWLNAGYGAHSDWYQEMTAACIQGIADGWMCKHEAQGLKYGRVTKPSEASHGFSVDVVSMQDIRGPHHRHPNGEIDLIMPLTPGAGSMAVMPAGKSTARTLPTIRPSATVQPMCCICCRTEK